MKGVNMAAKEGGEDKGDGKKKKRKRMNVKEIHKSFRQLGYEPKTQ